MIKMTETETSEQWKMEHDWKISKLLITNMNPKLFMYYTGKYDIYVQNVRPIKSVIPQGHQTQWFFDKPRHPHFAVVRSPSKDQVLEFISDLPEFEMSRVFKSGMDFPNIASAVDGGCLNSILMNTVNNMVGLRPSASFRIVSNRTDLRDITYEAAKYLKEKEDLPVTFDYDTYDYTLLVKGYERDNGKYAVITIVYGWDMPNHWSL